jgi:hypothetical protein
MSLFRLRRIFTENLRFFDSDENKFKRLDGQTVIKKMCGPAAIQFKDNFFRRRTYRDQFERAELEILESLKPLGLAGDKIKWKSESTIAPYRIDVLRKKIERNLSHTLGLAVARR